MKPYIDWFENKGVTVVPIPYDAPNLDELFHMINGLVIPGGNMSYMMKNATFVANITQLFELALERDEYFPIWGVCFGFEMLLFLVGGFTTLGHYNSHGLYPITLRKSRLFGSFPASYIQHLEKNKSTFHNHKYGISVEEFESHLHLRRFYTISATSVDDAGKEFVCAIEGKHYPFYGVQFHPERQKGTDAFLDFFILEMKKNKHMCSNLPTMTTYITFRKLKEYRELLRLLGCLFRDRTF
jgi:gamma-glutamyl hydrolase